MQGDGRTRRFYLIGIDAAPLWLLKKLERRKGMEPFACLFDSGNIGNLESTLPPMTGASWPSIYTGLPPGEHGTPDFFVMKKDHVKDVVYYDSKASPPFWEALAKKGYKCLVITPATDILLPETRNVDMVTGFPLRAKTNNEELRQLMESYQFDGEPDIEKMMTEGKISDAEASERYVRSIGKRSRLAKAMMEKNHYDFVYVCFTETDRIQHFTLNSERSMEYIAPLYLEIAKFVKYIEERVDREGSAMMIVSDHGAQPIHEKFLLNTWLIQNGYLKLKKSVMESIEAAHREHGKSQGSYALRERIMQSGLRKAYDRMPHHVKRATARLMGSLFSNASAGRYTRLHVFDYDLRNSTAFAEVSNGPVATLWINDGRFAGGPVGRSERKRLLDGIMKRLGEVRSREGDRVVAGYVDAIKYYKGTKKFIPPDIFIEAKKGYMIDIFNFSQSTLFMKPEHAKSGDHIRQGIVAYYSENSSINMNGMSVLNVAPSIMAYFGMAYRKGQSRMMGK